MEVLRKFQSATRFTALIICFAAMAGAQFPAFAQTPEMDALAARAAVAIQRFDKQKSVKSRLIVLDFVEARGTASQLGPSLADDFSAALARQAQGFELISRAQARGLADQEMIAPEVWRDPGMAQCMAYEAGATSVVTGLFGRARDAISLRVSVSRVQDWKNLFQRKVNIPRTSAMETLLAKAAVLPELHPLESSVQEVGKPGVGQPRCVDCPYPQFTSEAVRAKVQGSLVLRVVVTADGHASDVELLKGVACGLNEKAIEAVKQWKFEPAIGPSGKPVPVQIKIVVTFRQF